MAMTWGELKTQVIDLGFEEDDIYDEYERIIINAVNRALDVIRYKVFAQITDYYKLTKEWGSKDPITGQWVFPTHEHVSSATADTYTIVLPDNLTALLPLLAAHYVWLDDDITKATLYFNEYDMFKDQILMVCKRPQKAVIEGGW